MRNKFGISLDQYNEIYQNQNSVCFICLQGDTAGRLAVDHCHETGKVRGLLCRNCNRALGQFYDDIGALKRAIQYLERDEAPMSPILPLPNDKPHLDRARWRYLVETPDGFFRSWDEAGRYYEVHPTTVRDWCLVKKKPGFNAEKVFCA